MRYRPGERVLDIAFRGERGVYRYFDVPDVEWHTFRMAPSKGTYLNHTFKARGYGYEKLAVSSEATRAMRRSAVLDEDNLFWGEPLADEREDERRTGG